MTVVKTIFGGLVMLLFTVLSWLIGMVRLATLAFFASMVILSLLRSIS
jgi:hypothetical protein